MTQAVQSVSEDGISPTVLNCAFIEVTESIGDQGEATVQHTQESKFEICCVLLDHGARIPEYDMPPSPPERAQWPSGLRC